jgi:hypothetical protein
MEEGPIWEYKVKSGFGDPLKRTLAVDDSPECQEAVEFIDKLGVSYSIEHAKDVEETKDIVFPNILIGKNGTYLRGLRTIKVFRWDLQPTVKESEEDPEGAEKVIRIFEEVDKELEGEGFFEKIEEKGFVAP